MIPKTRAAVIRGRLFTRDSQPLAGATVKVEGRPDLGWTTTRANGVYDLAVAGGGFVTVSFSKPGYFDATRRVATVYGEFSPLEDVVLITPDTIATQIAFSAPVEVARGSVVQDQDGTRQATLLFKQGTTATMVMPNGSTQPLGTITVRATEFTVGPNGPSAMPATIADNTDYTYAVEFSADEARQAGASEVRFSKPVASYTENFLRFPVGARVPSGYYDRATNSWKASTDGRVIKVLSVANGLASIDVTGQGSVSPSDTLVKLGVDNAELQQLAVLYQPGATFWRVPIAHFSIHDFNWTTRAPRNAKWPNDLQPDPDVNPSCSEQEVGSEISVQEQLLGESFALVNTPYFLHYSTGRTPGYAVARTMKVRLSNDSLPAEVQKIRLDLSVAGRSLRREWAPTKNLTFEYVWDGIDAYGRRLYGPQPITAKVSYYYYGVEGPAPFFDDLSFGAYTADGEEFTAPIVPSRRLVPLSTEYKSFVGAWDARTEGLGGWTLSAHHVYDPVRKLLHKGDGTTVDARPIGEVIRRTVGNGFPGHSGDGGPASVATIANVAGLVSAPDGSIIFTDEIMLRRVDSAGVITTLPTNLGPMGLSGAAIAPDGSLYFGGQNEREYRYWPDGRIREIAGGGFAPVTEGADAHSVRLFAPLFNARAVGPDGTFFYLYDKVVWRLAANGRFYRAAGNLNRNCNSPVLEGPGLDINICATMLAVGRDNSIYVLTGGSLMRIGPDGISRLLTGGPGAVVGADNVPAIKTVLNAVNSVRLNPDGTILILENAGGRVRLISKEGHIRTVVGYGERGVVPIDGFLATATPLYFTRDVVTAHDGSIYVGSGDRRIYRVAPALPGMKLGEFFIPSEDGTELYVFGVDGRHIRTRDAITLRDRVTFQYDADGRLRSLTDAAGRATTLAYPSATARGQITSPNGIATALYLDQNGYVSALRGAGGDSITVQHDSLGLLQTLIDARGLSHSFTFDSVGRLKSDADSKGMQQLMAYMTSTSKTVTHTSAVGEVTTYTTRIEPDQSVTELVQRGSQRPDSTNTNINGITTMQTSMGASVSEWSVGDPRLGMPVSYAKRLDYMLGGGLSGAITRSRAFVGGAPGVFTATGTLLDSIRVNGRLYLDSTDFGTATAVKRSPVGRKALVQYDSRGNLALAQVWARLGRRFAYNLAGQLTSVTEGTRVDSIEWSPLGAPSRTIRADGRHVRFERDDKGNVLRSIVSDSLINTFTYDAESRPLTVALPGDRRYAFNYDAQGLLTRDSLSSAGVLLGEYTYDAARRLASVRRPGRASLAFTYGVFSRSSG